MVLTCFYWCTRYHYNVADARLGQHVERGNADGLLISCVASCSNLWAIIMDAGTGFTSQVYELSPFFLHKVHTSFWGYASLSCINLRFCRTYSSFGSTKCCRSGLWNNGRRITTLVRLLELTMEAPL